MTNFAGHPATATLTYNGIDLDAAHKITLEMEQVPDEAGRTKIYNRHVITAESVVVATAANTTDNDMETLRRKLTEYGAPLIYKDLGAGHDLVVNVGERRDVKFGPKPQVLMWEPLGDNNAARVTWRCEVHVPDCCFNERRTGVMALNWEINYSYRDGFLTRRISGYTEIAMTRLGRFIPDTADAYRGAFLPAKIEGFKRTNHEWNLSKDKSRIDFSITDAQVESPNAFLPGTVSCRGRYQMRWSPRFGEKGDPINERYTLEMDLKRAVDGHPGRLWLIFLDELKTRLTIQERNNKNWFLDEISINEGLFDYEMNFRVSWRATQILPNVLRGTSLFEPLDTDWRVWHTTIDNQLHNPYGLSGVRSLPSQDVIVDLCGTTLPSIGDQQTAKVYPNVRLGEIKNRCPPPEKSWLLYQTAIIPMEDGPVARHRPLQSPESSQGSPGPTGSNTRGLEFQAVGGQNDIIQRSGRMSYHIRFAGYARRICYEVPHPRITSIGEFAPEIVKAAYVPQHEKNALGVDIFTLKWDILYYIPNSPGVVNADTNIQIDKGTENG